MTACRADHRGVAERFGLPGGGSGGPRRGRISAGSGTRGARGRIYRAASRTRRRKSVSSRHATAAAIRASPGTLPKRARSPARLGVASMPRARSTVSTPAAVACLRPCKYARGGRLPAAFFVAPRLRLPDDRAGDRIVLRPGAFARTHRPCYPLQGRPCPRRQRSLDQGKIDLLRPPSRERAALRRLPIPPAPKEVNVEPGRACPGLRRHQHPHLRKAPRHGSERTLFIGKYSVEKNDIGLQNLP